MTPELDGRVYRDTEIPLLQEWMDRLKGDNTDDGDFKANDFSDFEKDFPLHRQLHCQDCKREAVPCLLYISTVLNLA